MRPIRIEGVIAFIPLTQGYEAIIDAADVAAVEGHSWIAMPRRYGAVYVVAKRGGGNRCRNLLLHRHLLQPPADMTVDQLDWDPLNNRRANLRIVTVAENCKRQRASASANGTVVYVRSRSRWQARAHRNGERIYLGMHETEVAAWGAVAAWRTSQEPVTE